jgi:uncharacterized protein
VRSAFDGPVEATHIHGMANARRRPILSLASGVRPSRPRSVAGYRAERCEESRRRLAGEWSFGGLSQRAGFLARQIGDSAVRQGFVLVGVLLGGALLATSALAADAMSVEQQNSLVQKHCAVCHNDRTNNGGLTLQRFSAADVAPSLAAMMLSKLTSGLPLATVAQAPSDRVAQAKVSQRLMSGAMMAAGIALPDMPTMRALTAALAAKASGATAWDVSRVDDPIAKTSRTTASILREVARKDDVAESYRLVLTCEARSREGHMQLAWSPVPTVGALSVTADGAMHGPFAVEGKETMGNGTGASGGLAAFLFPDPWLPSRSLIIRDLFPNETAEFSFRSLPPAARRSLAPCFAGT